MKPDDCPRFDSCAAPICPLDADWRLRTHVRDERVCGILLESMKPDAEANLRGVSAGKVLQAIVAVRGEVFARHGPIRRAAEKASRTGSKLAAAERLRPPPCDGEQISRVT